MQREIQVILSIPPLEVAIQKAQIKGFFSLKSCYVEGCVKMIYAKNPIGIKKACILKEKMTTLLIASPL